MQSDQQKNLIIAIVLSTVLMIVWMEFFAPKPAPVPQGADAGLAVAAAPAGDAGLSPTPTPAVPGGAAAAAEAAPAPGAPAAIAPKALPFSTKTHDFVFSNRGGGLEKALVKNGGVWPQRKFVSRQKDEKGELAPVDMVRLRSGAALPGSTELKGDLSMPLGTMFEAEAGANAVTFRAQTAEAQVEKRFTFFDGSYELRVEVSVTNKAAAPKKTTLSIAYPAWVDPKTQQTGSFFSPPPEVSQAMCRHGNSNDVLAHEKEQKTKTLAGPVQFAGFDERYFLGALYPRFTEPSSCVLFTDPAGDRNAYLEADLGTLAPGQTVKREFGLYLGPKELKELQRVDTQNKIGGAVSMLGQEPKSGGQPQVDPELAKSIDFGWWEVICRVLLEIMKVFQKGVVNWGIAIILLTVLVKAILYPLSVKQMASMESMRKLQPQIAELNKKYENDKEKRSQEQMRLYQENKVNPFGGCLPLLIQMPVWIALYRTLLSSFELYREPLLPFWITDLTAHDPFYILPLAMGVTMFITQKMQPAMGDPTQAKVMLYFMPIFFTFLMISLPAGLTLYIFTNNLLSIAQQKYLQHKFAKQDAAKASAGASAKAKK
ncbi:MAG TPA: membrane protein insertase YidC [Myxococcales bacterium]|jgi:YidC/Oxa1 family membrane protein insertase